MKANPWEVESFGRDCLGNITGYRVVRRYWKFTGNPHRSDGMNYVYECDSVHCGDIYVPGSFDKAWDAAKAKCETLNS